MIIGLCGLKQSGKNTAADILEKHATGRFHVVKYAFADKLREMAWNLNPFIECDERLQDVVTRMNGWDNAKVSIPEVRRLLQVLGTEAGREVLGENIWVDAVASQIQVLHLSLITDVRFPNEAAMVREFGGKLIQIERQAAIPTERDLHPSERMDFTPDYKVPNDGTLEEFEQRLASLFDELVGY